MRKANPRKRRNIADPITFRTKLFNESSAVLSALIENYANAQHYRTAVVLCNTLEIVVQNHITTLKYSAPATKEYDGLRHALRTTLDTEARLKQMKNRHRATGDWFLMNDDQEAIEVTFGQLVTVADTVSVRELIAAYAAAERIVTLEARNDG